MGKRAATSGRAVAFACQRTVMPTPALCLSLFGGAFVSSLLPLANAELMLLGAIALAPPGLDLALALIVTVGQMSGKVILYRAGRDIGGWGRKRSGPRVERLIARLQRKPEMVNTTFMASAFSGLPPFYLMTLAAGTLGVRTRTFLVLGSLGRFLRFSLIVLSPRFLEFVS